MIYVCSLSDMSACVASSRATHVISLLPPEEMPDTPLGIVVDRHLRLAIDDITEPVPGHILPASEHVSSLIEFASSWNRQTPLLVHCYAGVSRSMAAALILLCLEADGREAEAARLLRRRAPHAHPNRRMIALADDLLRREGRLIAAREAMGPAELVFRAPLIELPARLPE